MRDLENSCFWINAILRSATCIALSASEDSDTSDKSVSFFMTTDFRDLADVNHERKRVYPLYLRSVFEKQERKRLFSIFCKAHQAKASHWNHVFLLKYTFFLKIFYFFIIVSLNRNIIVFKVGYPHLNIVCGHILQICNIKCTI